MGQTLKLKIIEVDEQKKRIVCQPPAPWSREEAEPQRRPKPGPRLEEGEVVHGHRAPL